MGKIPLSRLEYNDGALKEDIAPIYGVILPVKEFLLKSKIFKLLKFAICTKRIEDSVKRKNLKWLIGLY